MHNTHTHTHTTYITCTKKLWSLSTVQHKTLHIKIQNSLSFISDKAQEMWWGKFLSSTTATIIVNVRSHAWRPHDPCNFSARLISPIWVWLQSLMNNVHHMWEHVCHTKTATMSHKNKRSNNGWHPQNTLQFKVMIKITGLGWNSSAMDLVAKLFAWSGSNNHKSLATHFLSQILQGFRLSI